MIRMIFIEHLGQFIGIQLENTLSVLRYFQESKLAASKICIDVMKNIGRDLKFPST